MRFFEAQTQARRHTWRLLWLYVAALLLTVAALTWVCGWLFPRGGSHTAYYVYTALLWTVLMVGASIYRTRRLMAEGGAGVAKALGGTRLHNRNVAGLERRLVNVVEEMALAAMLPVPKIYLLPDSSINAFAAGTAADDAVIGMTRGALQQLDRAELQAVVAHEFSHIANGDMRLNMRLTGWLFGLQLVGLCGRHIFFGSTDSNDDDSQEKESGEMLRQKAEEATAGCLLLLPFMLAGCALMLVGGIGSLLAGWIQAAICRQREYLADASAVQFTRQSEGMVGALRKIAVSPLHRLRSWHAPEYAHFMFGSVREPDIFDKLAATHPDTLSRIRRLNPFRAREWADEIKRAETLHLFDSGNWLAFAAARREAGWHDAETEAGARDALQRSQNMRGRIERFRPDAVARSEAWQRQAPRAWRSAAADSERMPLLLGVMLAGADGIPEGLVRQWVRENPLREETLARLQQQRLPAAYYADVVETLLPQAAADEVLPELHTQAQALFAANAAPSLMQGCAWLLLDAYGGCPADAAANDSSAAEIGAFGTLALPPSLQTAATAIPQAAWQALQQALHAAAQLPEHERRRIIADSQRLAAAAEPLSADTWLHLLRVALDVAD